MEQKKEREKETTTLKMYKHYMDTIHKYGLNIYAPKMIIDFFYGMRTNRDEGVSPSYIKGILSAIINEIKSKTPNHSVLENYKVLVKDLRRQLETSEKDHTNISGNIPKWSVVIKARQHAYDSKHLLNFVVLSIYTYVAPRRLGDYGDMLVHIGNTEPTNKKYNYYNMTTHEFIFNKYKTAKTFKQQIIRVPEELADILDFYIETKRYQ